MLPGSPWQTRSKRKSAKEVDHIELGEAGVDIGFDNLGRSQNRYAGIIGGDEQYYDSDDPSSDFSDAE